MRRSVAKQRARAWRPGEEEPEAEDVGFDAAANDLEEVISDLFPLRASVYLWK